MINHDIHSFKPSIFNEEKRDPIDYNVTSGNDSNGFEGPEKLLEVWFASAPDALPPGVAVGGLKSVPAEKWDQMLDLVNCKVLSVIQSDCIDAYLLSESSMFVFPHKLILKTCGTTTLLLGLSRMLNIAAVYAGFPHRKYCTAEETLATPYRVFYSRKNFLFPDKQQGPHRCWEKEVEFLDGIFEGGSAYVVGKVNGDHWYLYLTPPNTNFIFPNLSESKSVGSRKKCSIISINSSIPLPEGCIDNDETLEILMTDLDQEKAQQFYLDNAMRTAVTKNSNMTLQPQEKLARNSSSPEIGFLPSDDEDTASISSQNQDIFNFYQKSPTGLLTPPVETCQDEITQGHILGKVVSETSGLLDIYPTSKYPLANVDSHIFSPCGYSANGVIPSVDKNCAHYFTVHVTPEPHCSYASFESNVPLKQSGRDTATIVEQVVNIFKPGRFSMTLFEARPALEKLEQICPHKEFFLEDLQRKKAFQSNMDRITGYRRVDRIVHEFDGYTLVFRHFEREDWPKTPMSYESDM